MWKSRSSSCFLSSCVVGRTASEHQLFVRAPKQLDADPNPDMTTFWVSPLAVATLVVLVAAGITARPQPFGFGGGTPATRQAGTVDVVDTVEAEPPSALLPNASTTLGSCAGAPRLLLNEGVVRRALPSLRVSTVVRYDARGCFGDRDCTVACVKVEAPHGDWRPLSVQISDGRLGGSGIQITLLSEIGRGYSVRLLIYGRC